MKVAYWFCVCTKRRLVLRVVPCSESAKCGYFSSLLRPLPTPYSMHTVAHSLQSGVFHYSDHPIGMAMKQTLEIGAEMVICKEMEIASVKHEEKSEWNT